MKNTFSKSWNRSKQPRKQRKFRFNAPLHIKQKFMHSHLSKELKEKYKIRNIGVRKGDKVKISRGQFKGKSGKVDKCSIKRSMVYIGGIEFTKKDGAKKAFAIHPSNLIITELYLDDKKRQKKLSKETKENKKVNKNG